ncbi:unnamed protein product [Tetraodon nigroviridis]|uniref:(spotted green pufferfish) hypothetical protein n=1 Tax=Tetraodon nigroviridis TaxID=99883 RepID=Q4SK33_TETNG|nr:unnamed protein product [Tetraodon nigroviridis]
MLRWVLLLALCATCGGAGKQKKVKPGPKPSLARGWGGSLKWARSYEHALAKMVQSQKPLMVIHHKEECRFSQEPSLVSRRNVVGYHWSHAWFWGRTGVSTARTQQRPPTDEQQKKYSGLLCPMFAETETLKKAFADEQSIQEMAKDFIMLNLLEETPDPNLAPDGYYVPRILFVDPSMTVRTDIRGKYSNRQYAYEPGDMADLLKSMKKAKVLIHTEL